MANEIDEIAKESKRYVNAPVNPPAAAVQPRNVDISRPYEQRIGSVPYSNPNVQGGLLSAEAANYQQERGLTPNPVRGGASPIAAAAAPAAAPAAAEAAASPIQAAAQKAGSTFSRLTTGAASSIGGLASKVAPFVAPVIEGGRVLQVAVDPNTTKSQVAQQAVEGASRWGAGAGGAALGASLGALGGPAAPVTVPVGGVVGGIGGYLAGDAAVNKLRSMLGLGDKSPVQQVQDRNAAAAPAAGYQPARLTPDAQSRIAQLGAQSIPNPVAPAAAATAPATASQPAQAPAQPGARVRAVAAPSAQPAARSSIAQAAQPGQDGTVQIIRGLDQTVAIPGVNGGPMREIPLAAYEAGKTGAYQAAQAQADINAANPEQAKTQSKLAEIAAENAGRLGVAGIGAGASRYAVDQDVKQKNEALKNNVIFSDEVVQDEMGNSKVVKRAFRADGTPITQAPQGKPTMEVATQQAQNAIKAGANKEAVNGILTGMGYAPIK
jgi:hypothetical protein